MIELAILLIVFFGCNAFLRKIADPIDPFPTYFFGNLFFTSFVVMVTTLILFKNGPTICTHVVEIGGCNRNGCGVRMSDGSITEMGHPVIGQEWCRAPAVPRFRD